MTGPLSLAQIISAENFPALFRAATGHASARDVCPAPSTPPRELPADRSDFARDAQATGV